jgi:hypothetical protein
MMVRLHQPRRRSMHHSLPSALIALLLLGACADAKVEEPKPYLDSQRERIRQQAGTIHGNPKGIVIYSTKEDSGGATGNRAAGGAATGGYTWQAALESLDFMPLLQADAGGGVIITDWYAPPETPEERFKLTVYIRDAELRPDSVQVSVFRQLRQNGEWVDTPADPKTATSLEDNILSRARELRLAANPS